MKNKINRETIDKILEELRCKQETPTVEVTNSKRYLEECESEALEALEQAFPVPNDIKVEKDDINQPDEVTINCYAYALGLGDSSEYKNRLAGKPYDGVKTGVQSGFISWLFEKEYLEEKEPSEYCMVLYFDKQGLPKHAGILQQGGDEGAQIVRSRWGNYKAVLTHGLWYVPTEHGTEVKYCHPLSTKQSEKYFHEFLEKGVA